MLNRKFRLNKNSAFNATYRVNHSYYINGVVLFVGSKKKSESLTRVGFVVSKKTHKRAVKRNRLKRLMRESYRILLKDNEVGNSNQFMSLIFIGKEQALSMNFVEMKDTVKKLLEGIHV